MSNITGGRVPPSPPSPEGGGLRYLNHIRSWPLREQLVRPGSAIALATVLLFAVISPLVAPSSLNADSLRVLVVLSTVLALASIGQMLVVQQGGFDLSVAASISLAAVAVAHFGLHASTTAAVIQTVLITTGAGLFAGLVIVLFRVPPLIATLGLGLLLVGLNQSISKGVSTVSVTAGLVKFARDHFLGVPSAGWLCLVVVVVVATVSKRTTLGRRFELSGTSRVAARFAGLRTVGYESGAYAVAGLLYGVAGVLLAGYVQTPGTSSGTPYLFASVAAVVLGGAVIGGGRASVFATLVSAVFLTQLNAVVATTGGSAAVEYIIQAAIICVGIGLPAAQRATHIVSRRRRARIVTASRGDAGTGTANA